MVEIISIMCGIILVPLGIADFIVTHQLKKLEKIDRKLQLMEKYDLSDEDLTMDVRGRR